MLSVYDRALGSNAILNIKSTLNFSMKNDYHVITLPSNLNSSLNLFKMGGAYQINDEIIA